MTQDLVLCLNTVCSKAEGRDKLARFFQYMCRALLGFISFSAPTAGSRMFKLEEVARTSMTNLTAARRTHRWFKEVPVIQSIPKSLALEDPVDRVLEVLTKTLLAAFFIIDHIGLLKQWKILPGGKRAGSGTIQLGLKVFCLSNVFGIIFQMKKFFALAAKEEKSPEEMTCLKLATKHLLLIIQTAHMSLLWKSHDALVGIAGMITSAMDVHGQLPLKARPSPPAAVAPPKAAPEAEAATPALTESGVKVKSS
mmetsp:Transcript_45920/g.132444  ORF Transcript_45920/g.132444 Transcript_45920/m.132444 type:complete len:253 (+) Transcript_45920:92-850(+)